MVPPHELIAAGKLSFCRVTRALGAPGRFARRPNIGPLDDVGNRDLAPGEPGWADLLRSGTEALSRAGARISRWLEDHQEGLGMLVSGLVLIAYLQPRLAELQQRFEDSEWAYVLERLDFLDGLVLMMLLDEAIEGNPRVRRLTSSKGRCATSASSANVDRSSRWLRSATPSATSF